MMTDRDLCAPRDYILKRIKTSWSNTGWHEKAACKGADTNLFFSPRARERERALAICQTCPVIQECGNWYRENRADNPVGVWGGRWYPPKKDGDLLE